LGQLSSDIRRINDEDDLRLVVNLKEMFDLPFFPQNDGLKQAIGQAILDQIKDNAQSAKFLAGSTAKGYSKAYAESGAGIVYGKKTGAKPTLTASGDMLESMNIDVSDDANKLIILFTDSENSQKAHGHVNGSDVLPKRDFFGLDQADLNRIKRQFDNEVIDAVAQELAGEVISQGEETDLDFISRLLDGEG
jgi:hypothetical protein